MRYHYLYKTTNLVNQKFYIGVHSTNNLDDGYLGSGNQILRAIEKYGDKSFSKKILKFCNSREELAQLERQVVNEKLLLRDDVYNIRLGGLVKPDNIKHPIEVRQQMSETRRKIWSDPEYKKRLLDARTPRSEESNKRASESYKKHWANPTKRAELLAARSPDSIETRRKKSEAVIEHCKCPIYRRTRAEKSKAAINTPEVREKKSTNLKSKWQDPLFRQTKLDGMKARFDKIKQDKAELIQILPNLLKYISIDTLTQF